MKNRDEMLGRLEAVLSPMDAPVSAENVMLRAEVTRLQCLLLAAIELHTMDEAAIARLQEWRDRVTGAAKKLLHITSTRWDIDVLDEVEKFEAVIKPLLSKDDNVEQVDVPG